jgi:uncharacterized protein YqhQ
MFRALFQYGPLKWKAINYKCGASFLFVIQRFFVHLLISAINVLLQVV